VSPKNVLLACFVVSSFVLATSAGCGDDESAPGFSCPKVGDKACTNATAATQAQVDLCTKCEKEERAYDSCLGQRCEPNGNLRQPGANECRTESDALLACYRGGPVDGGGGATDAAGGG
jgi:hypothetical protein